MKKTIVTGQELANRFGLTPRRVEQLCATGVFDRVKRGWYDLDACTRKYIRHLKTWRAAARVPASGKDLAQCFGVSSATIRQLVLAGVLPKIAHGKYDLFACTQAYIDYLQRSGQLALPGVDQ